MRYFLTFDGAPCENTRNILDALKEYDIKATFFVEGHRIEGNEKILKRIVEEGHTLGNHSFSHEVMEDMSWEEVRAEFILCEEKIYRIAGVRTNLIRPPWGKIGKEALKNLEDLGNRMVLWNTSIRDWEAKDVEDLSERLIACASDGVIPVMHDRIEYGPEALRLAIPVLLQRGYTFEALG